MPITVTQLSDTEIQIEETQTVTSSVRLIDCSFRIYHSDSSTPEDIAGYYCEVSSPAGTYTFRVDFGADQQTFLNDLQSLFALYVAKLQGA